MSLPFLKLAGDAYTQGLAEGKELQDSIAHNLEVYFRRWAQRAYPKLIYFNEVKKGGHFASWEEPQLFAEELRAAFKSLRGSQLTAAR